MLRLVHREAPLGLIVITSNYISKVKQLLTGEFPSHKRFVWAACDMALLMICHPWIIADT